MLKRMLKLATLLAPLVLIVGCATKPTASYNYSAFEASNPHSILVLPPVNNSPDVSATFSVYAQVTHPLAEAGYYVLPVAVVNETFKQNGLTNATDIHNVNPQKLQQIFGADAALYLTVTQYGSTYNIISSVVTVAAEAKLVDLKTGALLWKNNVVVVDKGDQGNAGGGLLGVLVKAAVTQIMNSQLDRAYMVAHTANEQLLAGGQVNGLLYGPRSPNYKGRSRALASAASSPMPPPAAQAAVTAAPALVNENAAPVAALAVSQTSAAPVIVQTAMPVPVAPATFLPKVPATVATTTKRAPANAMAVPAAQALAPQAAVAAATEPSGPEQRYAEVLRRAQAHHEALDPASNWYRRDLYEWLMERKAEFIVAGNAPDVALQRAITLMETR